MYSCKDCNRSYRTRTSLTRHSHNHSRQGTHTCNVCNVHFRRHDLLARHSKIHEESVPESSTNVQARQRCHTACSNCRNERKRCDGKRPCETCISNGRACSYSSSRRVSQPATLAAETSSRQGDRRSSIVLNDVHTDDDPSFDLDARGEQFDLPSTNALSSPPLVEQQDAMQTDPTSRGLDMSLSDQVSTLGSNDLASLSMHPDPYMTPWADVWPWTHQSIFFQEGLGMFNSESDGLIESFGPSSFVDVRNFDDYPIASSFSNNQIGAPSQELPQIHGNVTASGVESNDERLSAEQLQVAIINDIVSTAFNMETPRFDQTLYRATKSQEIQAAFLSNIRPSNSMNEGKSLLDYYVDLFFERFQPLWPLLWRQNFENYADLHPILYLVLISIGTMYNGRASQRFGSMLHKHIRNALFMLPLEIDLPEKDLLQIGCALLHAQVTALYFEQQHAFSASQRLAGILVAFAHRLDLFTLRRAAPEAHPEAHLEGSGNAINTERKIKLWAMNESRKRLAYGILRVETFTSLILNTKPLIDYEQVNLELPASDKLWLSPMDSTQALIDAIDQEKNFWNGILYSDLVRIALDRNESLPITNGIGHELLLFGLQHAVWRFSHDQDLFSRLSGPNKSSDSDLEPLYNNSHIIEPRRRDHLDFTKRAMADLRKEKQNTLEALAKWKNALANSQLADQDTRNRSLYLSSSLLYHLSLVRLHAPIAILQQAAYDLNIRENLKDEMIKKIHDWARSSDADIAVKHACLIWTLIDSETSRPPDEQARYNILGLIGLHQAAVTAWAYSSVHRTNSVSLDMASERSKAPGLELCRNNIAPLLQNFIRLYPKISPFGMQSSFAKIATNMAKGALPDRYV